jgi:hypothetical protein
MDGWSDILNNLMIHQSNPILPALYCVALIFLGSFFMLNLMLAVIMESYMESEMKGAERYHIELLE